MQWSRDWKMGIHPAKSKILHIGRENPGMPYQMNGTEIPTVSLEKDIGFWISEDQSSTTHVQKAKGKAMAKIIRIRRNFSYIDKRAFYALSTTRESDHIWIMVWLLAHQAHQQRQRH